MNRLVRAALMLAAALLVAARAFACPVCVVGPGLSPAQQLMNADRVLLIAAERAEWKTIEVIKGPLADVPPGELPPGSGTVVALRDPMSKWLVLGSLPPAEVPWLKQVVVGRSTLEMSDADWRARVRFHLPYLEHAVPLIAETAYSEVARAPYAAMRAARSQLDAARLQRWLDDPALASRRSLYTLLLGIVGGQTATQRIERQLTAAEREQDFSELAALLVADMELRGPPSVVSIEKRYLAQRGPLTRDLQAALLTLSEQGQADAAVPRARVVEAYRAFIRSEHPLAGFVAPDFQRWRDWSAVADYAALIRSGAWQQPASIYAMYGYLSSAPGPEARAAAAAIKQRPAQP